MQKPANKDFVNIAVENFTRNKALVNHTELMDLTYSMLDKIKFQILMTTLKSF